MSSDATLHAAINQKLNTKLEELCVACGDPTEIDEAFAKEYFSVLSELDLEKSASAAPAGGIITFVSHDSQAHPGGTKVLFKVIIPGKSKQFFVATGEAGEYTLA